MNVQYCRPGVFHIDGGYLTALLPGVQLLPKTTGRNRCCMPTVRVQSFQNAGRRSLRVCGCADRGVAGEACGVAAQEGFMAQDDAGAQEAYERELDEEEDIRRMDAEAAARRAQGASHASAATAGPSSGAAPAQNSAGEPPRTAGCVATRTHKLSVM